MLNLWVARDLYDRSKVKCVRTVFIKYYFLFPYVTAFVLEKFRQTHKFRLYSTPKRLSSAATPWKTIHIPALNTTGSRVRIATVLAISSQWNDLMSAAGWSDWTPSQMTSSCVSYSIPVNCDQPLSHAKLRYFEPGFELGSLDQTIDMRTGSTSRAYLGSCFLKTACQCKKL